ncbi:MULTISPECIES: mechanosensitive ion channel family protein [unclassified Pseudomonas]|uniref:mechanosensitive ion channel family protein n=1 Tax=unclassified Pseudomonas TaxID=196821 RepID=UPI000BD2226F|nr:MULTISPECIES: mechanosensitive ion channel domain-containing protein [unclassified Pseudomonas]PVZ19525.1 small-conductance mechanosensitive channel [Pseudomonas sp. URIL14HWK12:I12]PVZ22890.1 small-conductance mechanosensitive channel [Pseudomonas sp. URIL14HWK12:I10]PVZ37480.1 small-conductance mechanosensitive channel [Pseudomonas sp. URIL14HWK12:I11]SNZ14891.1 Small-conductance mechanosensitive channel [Pseudomonas sp. URIL14HWK12:I9]
MPRLCLLLLLTLLSLNLNAATTAATPAQPPEPLVQGGLLGTLGSSLDSLQDSLNLNDSLVDTWRLRTDRAADEAGKLLDQHDADDSLWLTRDVLIISACWIGSFAVLHLLARTFWARAGRVGPFRHRPRLHEVFGYLLRFTTPALLALPITLSVAQHLALSPARALALSLAYATGSGAFSTSIVMCVITLFDAGHKRAAVRVLRQHTPRPLFLIGFFAALGDALTSPQIARQLGSNLTSSLAVFCGLAATVLFAALVLRMRRPVAHLIRNRSYHVRHQHRAVQETLRIFSALWYLPILLMILVSMVHLIGAGEESQQALQRALMTTVLLVGAVFLSTLAHHLLRPHVSGDPERSRPYLELVRSLGHALARVAIAVAFIELLARIWGFSVLAFAASNSVGRAISDSLSAIGLILLVTWLLWVVIDTAIQEALKPAVGKRASRQPSTRVKTILPMLRNAAKIVLVVICVITTMANLGINVAPLLAGAGVVGLAIGFGSQQLVQDVITGLFILIEDTIAIGDWVVLDSGHAGTVESLTVRTLRLRDGKGFVHSVPFGQIKAVTNQSRQFAYAFFSVQVTYDSDIDTALRLIRETADDIEQDILLRSSLQGPFQVFGVDKMDLNGITLTAQFRTTSGGQYGIGRAFNERLKKKVDEVDNVNFAQYLMAPRPQ